VTRNVPGSAPQVSAVSEVPGDWDDLRASASANEFPHDPLWSELAARHEPTASNVWIAVHAEGRLIAGAPLLKRRRRGLARLESQLDGTVAGPLLRDDLPPSLRDEALGAVLTAAAELLGGTTGLVAMTVAGPDRQLLATRAQALGWIVDDYDSAIVDCRDGLEHVERELWTNNRRNERNRGLKRGCTLHGGADVEALERWYPIYLARTRAWAQAAIPLGFMRDLLREAPQQACFDHVRLDGEVVGGHFGFVSRDRLMAWQGAARSDLARSHFLTTLLYWRNIETACERGLAGVDFGGYVGRDSLWDFKRRCGATGERRTQLQRRSWLGRLHRWLADARAARGGGLS
jgi:CelD/BcsL family acetyltransferase involved in cellulose biosynthesis